MMKHPTDDELNDYHDGLLTDEARSAIEAHLAGCVECEDRSAALADLLDQLHGVPRAIDPPPAVWAAIRGAVEADKVASIGGATPPGRPGQESRRESTSRTDEPRASAETDDARASAETDDVQASASAEDAVGIANTDEAHIAPPGETPVIAGADERPAVPADVSHPGRADTNPGRSPRRTRPWRLAAAAVLLVVASSAVTVWVMHEPGPTADELITRRIAGEQSLARFAELEAVYLRATADLMEAIERERRFIPPDVVGRAEQSLAILDQAVREVRMALADDPGNAALVEMALAAHRRKLELLEQVRQWSSET